MADNQRRDTSAHGNRYNNGPLVSVAVADKAGSWMAGRFHGDPELVEQAQLAADAGLEIELFGVVFTADTVTAGGALAALASYSPGRVIVTEAPDMIIEAFQAAARTHRHLTSAHDSNNFGEMP